MSSKVTRDHHSWTRDITVNKGSPMTITLKDVTNSQLHIKSDGAAAPKLVLSGESQESIGAPELYFVSRRGSGVDAQDNDYLGNIVFYGNDDGTPSEQIYSSIECTIDDATSGEESGKLTLKVANHDGGRESGLVLTGGSADAEVDVNIGSGTSSLTTIAGDLDIDGDAITSAGALTITPGSSSSLSFIPDGRAIFDMHTDGVLVDVDFSNTIAGAYIGFEIDYDKAGASTSNNTITGLKIDLDNTTAENGTNTAYGILCTPTLTHAADAGTPSVYGGVFVAIGGTNGTSIAQGLHVEASGADTNTGISIKCANGGNDLRIVSSADVTDYCQISTIAAGATTFSTVDTTVGATAHLTLDPDGDLIISGADTKIDATKKLYLDGGGDTYIREASADQMEFYIGGDRMFMCDENGDDGNQTIFMTSSVGFAPHIETFSDDSIIGSGATDDTHIDFRHGNKVYLSVTGDITNMNLIFPQMNGNFTLLLSYNGDHDITNWKVFIADESAASVATVKWPGGTAPATTASGMDIFSFYWDIEPQTAFGVASLAFATP